MCIQQQMKKNMKNDFRLLKSIQSKPTVSLIFVIVRSVKKILYVFINDQNIV